jgi:hypothetical protein
MNGGTYAGGDGRRCRSRWMSVAAERAEGRQSKQRGGGASKGVRKGIWRQSGRGLGL